MGDHEEQRVRLVVLGGAGVGKSCIVKRFLFNTYCDKYRSTVEDLYNREYNFGPTTLKVDILDTSGDMQFPAMRRLCIATAHGFLLVYSVTSAPSLATVQRCLEEIQEGRNDFQEVPIVIAGNKVDLCRENQEVSMDDVKDWMQRDVPKLRVKLLECSAKDDFNVKEIFRSLLTLSRLVPQDSADVAEGLKRRSSAYGKRRGLSPHLNPEKSASSSDGAKPRSRSLIRRASRKTKQQIREAQPDDCQIS